jgi:hypothetical protein
MVQKLGNSQLWYSVPFASIMPAFAQVNEVHQSGKTERNKFVGVRAWSVNVAKMIDVRIFEVIVIFGVFDSLSCCFFCSIL